LPYTPHTWVDGSVAAPAGGLSAARLTDIENAIVASYTLYNVKDVAFGAKGDGATDDTAAINTAIAALSAGQTLFFPAGTYITNGGHVLPTVLGASVRGAGSGATTIQLASSSSHADILTAPGDYTLIRDIGLNGNYPTNATSRALVLTGWRPNVQCIEVSATGSDGIVLNHGASQSGRVSDFHVTGCQGHGININTSNSDCIIHNGFTDSSGIATSTVSHGVFDQAGSIFSNLHTWGNRGAGIRFNASGGQLSNSYVETNASNGVYLNAGHGARISNTRVWSNGGFGIYGFNTNRVGIVGCRIHANTGDGIQGDGTSSWWTVAGCDFANDGGAVIVGNNTQDTAVKLNAATSGDFWNVQSNTIQGMTAGSTIAAVVNFTGSSGTHNAQANNIVA
jgi:hypothetical protein